ncbi:PAS domain-containing hybrid sensor histidine kinase/response regulator [Planctobacterium marinum]|uniref:histidine kinase n=1 Tax=Planctobacterium marinum TaxID=1631968 RepID=A0AA48HL30_9ALTE|nr:hybrid sensor histidine kinase/response regulator [Planctobacterium marinum]
MHNEPSFNVTFNRVHKKQDVPGFPTNMDEGALRTFLEITVENSNDGIFWLTSDAQIAYLNTSACQRLDYSPDELMGKFVWDLDPLFPKQVWPEFWREFVAAGHIQFESKHETKWGKIIPVFIRAILVRIGDEDMQVAFVQDLSEQKAQQAQLRTYKKDLQQLQKFTAEPDPKEENLWLKNMAERLNKLEVAANIGTWEVDLTSNKLTWSEQTRRIHEVDTDYHPNVEEAINFYKAGKDRVTITKLFNNAVNACVPWDVELTIVTQMGRERIVRVIGNAEADDGQCVRVFGVFQDITDKYGLRQELLASQKSMQDIMDHSPAVVYVKDIEGRYLFVNKKYEQVLSIPRNKVLGNKDTDFLPPSVAQEVMANDRRVIISGEHHEIEEEIPQEEGVRLYISEKFPLFNSDGEIYAMCGISTDITERRQQEEQLRRTQKMDALGKLTGGVAHDFNNLLGIIVGYANLIERSSAALDGAIFNQAQHITKACTRGEKLTRRLLAFSSKQSLQKQVVNLNDVIQNNVDMLQKIMTVSIELQLELSPDLWWCEIDVSDFEDALINMVLNAIHALEHKGTLTISTQNKIFQPAKKKQRSDTQFVQLAIEDNGCGMSPDTQEQLFEPFFTTKAEKGTGLGLSQVYGFTQRSKGFVEVHSNLGQGTRFELYFPSKPAPDGRTENAQSQERSLLQGSESILVVDDERELVEIARLMLSAYGYSVSGCYSGAEAIQKMQKQPFDLVISDVIMPHMDGWELSRTLMEDFPNTKILLVSGYIGDRCADTHPHIEEEQVLTKPFSSETLLKRVKALLNT